MFGGPGFNGFPFPVGVASGGMGLPRDPTIKLFWRARQFTFTDSPFAITGTLSRSGYDDLSVNFSAAPSPLARSAADERFLAVDGGFGAMLPTGARPDLGDDFFSFSGMWFDPADWIQTDPTTGKLKPTIRMGFNPDNGTYYPTAVVNGSISVGTGLFGGSGDSMDIILHFGSSDGGPSLMGPTGEMGGYGEPRWRYSAFSKMFYVGYIAAKMDGSDVLGFLVYARIEMVIHYSGDIPTDPDERRDMMAPVPEDWTLALGISEGTWNAVQFWPYAGKAGGAIYNETTGELLGGRDPIKS